MRHRRSCATPIPRRRCDAGPRARTSSATRSGTTTCSVGTSPGDTDIWADFRDRRAEAGFDPEAVALAAANQDRLGAKVVASRAPPGCAARSATPDQVRDYLRRYEDCGVDMLILSSAAGRNRHEHIMESLELFAPRGPARVPRTRRSTTNARRQRRLAPVIEQVLARKPASDHPPLDPDYEIPAYPRQSADDGDSDKFHRWLDDYRDKIVRGEDVSKRLA